LTTPQQVGNFDEHTWGISVSAINFSPRPAGVRGAGYVETSVLHIVRLAGGSRASFSSYFDSKDDALSVLVDELTDDVRRRDATGRRCDDVDADPSSRYFTHRTRPT